MLWVVVVVVVVVLTCFCFFVSTFVIRSGFRKSYCILISCTYVDF